MTTIFKFASRKDASISPVVPRRDRSNLVGLFAEEPAEDWRAWVIALLGYLVVVVGMVLVRVADLQSIAKGLGHRQNASPCKR